MKKIPLRDINDEDEFWCGAKFQKHGTKLTNPPQNEDYYEFMLFLDTGLKGWMICAHTDKWERGTVVCHVKETKGLGRRTVYAKEFKRSMVLEAELDDWYFIDDDIRDTRTINKK